MSDCTCIYSCTGGVMSVPLRVVSPVVLVFLPQKHPSTKNTTELSIDAVTDDDTATVTVTIALIIHC